MKLRPGRIRHDIRTQRDDHLRQTRRDDASGSMQRRQHEEMQGDDGGSGIARQGEDETAVGIAAAVLERYRREGRRFAGLHGHAAEVDGPAERALDARFQQVQFAHGHAARGDDDVDGAERCAELRLDVFGPGAGWGRAVSGAFVRGGYGVGFAWPV